MSAYGDFLSSFAELYEEFGVCKYKTKVGHGYDIEPPYRFIVAIKQTSDIVSNTKGSSRNSSSAGTSQGLISINAGYVLWSFEPLSVIDEFIVIEEEYYKPTGKSVYDIEGGFYRTEVRMVAGSTDGVTELPVIQGAFE